ncbi:MAG TPA: hypothetical protein VKU80_07090 [Planctomycetota bacterium]|nr:hypothetical protein [Planctomycetota bacterium]
MNDDATAALGRHQGQLHRLGIGEDPDPGEWTVDDGTNIEPEAFEPDPQNG